MAAVVLWAMGICSRDEMVLVNAMSVCVLVILEAMEVVVGAVVVIGGFGGDSDSSVGDNAGGGVGTGGTECDDDTASGFGAR